MYFNRAKSLSVLFSCKSGQHWLIIFWMDKTHKNSNKVEYHRCLKKWLMFDFSVIGIKTLCPDITSAHICNFTRHILQLSWIQIHLMFNALPLLFSPMICYSTVHAGQFLINSYFQCCGIKN